MIPAYDCCSHCADQVHITVNDHTLPCPHPRCDAPTKEIRMTQPEVPPTAIQMEVCGGRLDGAQVAVIDTSDLALAVIVDPTGRLDMQTKMEPQDTLNTLQTITDLYANTHGLTAQTAAPPMPVHVIPDCTIESVSFLAGGDVATTFTYTAPDGTRRRVEYVGPANATIVSGP